MSGMVDLVRREIGRALAGVRGALRAVSETTHRATPVQLVTGRGMGEELLKDLELFQHFGFTSAPPAGTQLIVLPLGGKTSAGVLVASEHGSYRFSLGADGEAALYNQLGDVVHMRADRTIHVVAETKVLIDTSEVEINAASEVVINTPSFTVNASGTVALNTPTVAASTAVTTGTTVAAGTAITAGTNITATGNVADAGGAKTMAAMRAAYNSHTHPETGGSGPTGAPNESM